MVATSPAAGVLAEQLYGPVMGWMPKVEKRLQVELQSRYETVAPLLRHGGQLGGKRLRLWCSFQGRLSIRFGSETITWCWALSWKWFTPQH
jgi:hypothetical protein